MKLLRRIALCACILALGLTVGFVVTAASIAYYAGVTLFSYGKIVADTLRGAWGDVAGCVLFAGSISIFWLI